MNGRPREYSRFLIKAKRERIRGNLRPRHHRRRRTRGKGNRRAVHDVVKRPFNYPLGLLLIKMLTNEN